MQTFEQFIEEFDPNQPRDKNGKWVAGKKKANIAHAVAKWKELGYDVEHWHRPGTKVAAIYGNNTGKIHINTASKYWADPVAWNAHNHKIGYMSSDDPYHTLYHEIGHALYEPPDNWMTYAHGEMAKKHVSKYAGANPKEFVSEVHAGLMAGKTYPPEIMQMFNQYAKKRNA